ncbi:MAG TPA: PAS domain-containing protein [Patescibacteria group bacterium]|nr:PAS domain-containing protein [Patescibacteria group bacterium]
MNFGSGAELDKFETAMEAIGLAWWWMELPSGVIFFSPNKAKMIGRNPSDFIHYRHFTDLVHPEDYAHIMQDMSDHLDGKKPLYETTYRIKHNDGHYVQFVDRGRIVGKKDGETMVAGFVFDEAEFPLKATAAAQMLY